MTVIAYRNGVLAADTGVWRGALWIGEVEKIARIGPVLAGASGRETDVQVFFEWVLNGRNPDARPEMSKDFEGCVVEPDGVFRLYHKKLIASSGTSEWGSAGSGFEFLSGCMAAGATAPEAIALAIKYHESAAGRVTTLKLADQPLDVEAEEDPEATGEWPSVTLGADPEAAKQRFLEERGLV